MVKIKPGVLLGAGLGITGLVLIFLSRKAGAEPPPPPPDKANLYGKVTDVETVEGIDGVTVSLWDSFIDPDTGLPIPGPATTYTHDGGNYVFSNLEVGAYSRLEFTKDGYEPVTITAPVLVEGNNEVNIEMVVEGGPPPAEIIIVDASVDPTEVKVGEPVSIGVQLKNIGGSSGSHELVCEVDGVIFSQSVTLAPDETTWVNFTFIPDEAGTYQVTAEGLTLGTIIVTALPGRIGSFTLYAINFDSRATRWRTIYRDDTHQDNRYLYTWRSLASSFEIIDIDLDHCEIRVSQRKNGLIGATWYGPFSGIADGGDYVLDLVEGTLTQI